MSILAWHFVNDKLRDGRDIPKDGELLVHEGALELCKTGLHASESIMDALRYAPGNTLCRVEMSGSMALGDDKLCSTERTVVWRIDAEPILFEASRKFALEVIHLWDSPDVVKEFLETGNPDIRAAARAAARDAARAAARDAAGDAARDAAGDAARTLQEKILLDLVRKAHGSEDLDK